MVRRAVVVALLMAAVFAMASCGRNSPESSAPPTTSVRENPALTAAAATVQPLLQASYPDSFAGLVLHHEVPVLVIYRKPDASLDTEVEKVVSGVRVEFHDAKYTLVEMKAAADKVMDDREYWKGRGLTVNTVGPAADGSGVTVTSTTDAGDFAGALQERYPAMSFVVRKGSEVVHPVYTGPPPTYSSPPSR